MSLVQFYDRKSKMMISEKVAGGFFLTLLYGNPLGKLALHTIMKRKALSFLVGKLMDSPFSKNRIQSFIDDFEIPMDDFIAENYMSFNDFFIRKIKPEMRPIEKNIEKIVSPADGKLLCFPKITKETEFLVKGQTFKLRRFLQSHEQYEKYKNGAMLIIRLCPTDYHRYHFPYDGEIREEHDINGSLYSVSPIAILKKPSIFWENKRQYARIITSFGEYLYAEVGATMVGSMVQTCKSKFHKKGEEKGYFKFGGSTIMLLFPENKIKIDEDLIQKSNELIEVQVKVGEPIATII